MAEWLAFVTSHTSPAPVVFVLAQKGLFFSLSFPPIILWWRFLCYEFTISFPHTCSLLCKALCIIQILFLSVFPSLSIMSTPKTRLRSVVYPIIVHLLTPLFQIKTITRRTSFSIPRVISRAWTWFQTFKAPTTTVVVGLVDIAIVDYKYCEDFGPARGYSGATHCYPSAALCILEQRSALLEQQSTNHPGATLNYFESP